MTTKQLISKKDLENKETIFNLDISYLDKILKIAGKKYLNIFRVETEDELVDINSIYVLSYVKQKISKEKQLYDTIVNTLEQYVDHLNGNAKKYIELYKEILWNHDFLLYKTYQALKNKNKQIWDSLDDKNKQIIIEFLAQLTKIKEINNVEKYIDIILNNKKESSKEFKSFIKKIDELIFELKHENIFLEQEKKIFELKNKEKWKTMTNEEKDKVKEIKENIGKIKEENMTEKNTPKYKKGISVILDVVSENWEKYRAWTLFVKEIIKRYWFESKKFYFNLLDNEILLNANKISDNKFLTNIKSKLKKKTFKKSNFELNEFNNLDRIKEVYSYTDKYNNLNLNIAEYLEKAQKAKIKKEEQVKEIIKHLNEFKKFVVPYEDFYICKKGLNKIMIDKNYITYIFYIDKIHLTFDILKLKWFFLSLWSINNINKMFLDFKLEDINKALKDRFKVGVLSISENKWNKFIDTIKSLNKNKEIDKYNIETYAEIITRKLFWLHIEPFRLSVDSQWREYYNRKEILKSSKTEDKLNSTFSSEIFHLALDEEINCNISECIK